MEASIIVAIISGGVALISPIITHFVTKKVMKEKDKELISGRLTYIAGKWKGELIQEFNDKLIIIDLEITFTAGEKIVDGIANFTSPLNNSLTTLHFTGGFYYERYIKFDYKNPDESVIQFGCSILELSSDGKNLEGKYVGYGSNTNQIVDGKVSLKRSI